MKITLKAAHLYLFCGSTPEGTQFQSIVKETSELKECSLTQFGPSAQIEHP